MACLPFTIFFSFAPVSDITEPGSVPPILSFNPPIHPINVFILPFFATNKILALFIPSAQALLNVRSFSNYLEK